MQPGRKIRLLILGSCVSRDIFEFCDASDFEIVEYFARTGLASLNGAPAIDQVALDQIISPFQRRVVSYDMDKSFWTKLESLSFDLLLLDFIDDRFDVLRTKDGGLLTLSSDYVAVAGKPPRRGRITSTSKEKHRLWLAGWQRLLTELDRLKLRDKVVVNQVGWADRTIAGQALEHPAAAKRAALNGMLSWMHDHIELTLPEARWLTYPEALLQADPGHKWGLAPFHYAQGFYDQAILQLREHAEDRPRRPSACADTNPFARATT